MRIDNQRGFALPAAIGALVIIGILVTAGFFMAQQELRIGVASHNANQAVNIAQMGANDVMANWNGYQLSRIRPWQTATVTQTVTGGSWTVSITNANNYVYRLHATGTVTQGGVMWAGASRTIGVVAKMLFADIDPPGALTTRGNVTVKGSAAINGNDYVPPLWAPYCTTVPTTNMPGVVTDAGSTVTSSGGAIVAGNPPSVLDPTVVTSTFNDFGNLTWEQLTALAQAEGKNVTSLGSTINGTAPVVAGGVCNEAVLTNWGDTLPTAPCGAYFPLIYHGGNLTIQSGAYGQGLLLVQGNLQLRGNFLFYGIIIVQGTFGTAGSGNRIIGGVLAGNDLSLTETLTGGSTITYSRCAVQRAVLNNRNLSRARPVSQRSWVDLTAVTN